MDLGTLVAHLRADASRLADDLRGGTEQVGKWGESLAPALGGAGLAAGAALAGSVVQAMEHERIGDQFAAQLPNADVAAVAGEAAGRLYANAYGDSLESVHAATNAVVTSISGMATASASDVEAMTAQFLDLSTAMEIDVTRAAQVAGQMVTTGLATDGAHAADLLTAAMQRVPTAVREDIVDAVDEYGPFLAEVGLQGEEAFGLLVAAAQDGAFGIDKTGDAIAEFTKVLVTASPEDFADQFASMGLDFAALQGQFAQGGDAAASAFDQIVSGLSSIGDPLAQQQAAIALFGTPLEDLNANEIPAFLASLDSTANSLGDVSQANEQLGATLNENAATSWTSVQRQAEMFAVSIGERLLPYVSEFLMILSTQLGPWLEQTAGFLQRNQETLIPLAAAIGGAVGTILLIVGALKAWAAIQAVLNIVMTANPIGILIVAIGALVALIVYLATQTTFFQDVWSIAWAGMQVAFDATWSWIQRQWATFDRVIIDPVAAGIGEAVAWFQRMQDRVMGVIDWVRANWPLLLAIITGPIGLAVLIVSRHWDEITAGAGRLVDWFRGLPERIRGALAGVGDAITAPFRAGFRSIASLWNRSVAEIGFTVPSWVPGVGGRSFSIPSIPALARGGIARAVPGGHVVQVAEGGRDELITPLNPDGSIPGMDGGSSSVELILSTGPGASDVDQLLITILRRAIKQRGGDPVSVLAAA